jgi:hypothetical protein
VVGSVARAPKLARRVSVVAVIAAIGSMAAIVPPTRISSNRIILVFIR